ncbi:DNA polymerase sigma [Phaffia rhodozyma]|uniref:polynucleotide adenylyltransferase n=1 Tax=Phaffia rhodozyma TaxID=264483 RepID=A0A0F7SVF5_PHARH|nr:DNA polymerase sigma [Phaffia rhodozyma]
MADSTNAFNINQGFIAFEVSPEPEVAPSSVHASTSKPSDGHNAVRSSGKGKEPARESNKRSREDGEFDPNDPDAYRNLKEERRAAGRFTPWTEGLDWNSCKNPAELLNREITSFVSYISPTVKEHATRTHIVELIRRAVVNQWKDAKVVPFGSFETGLYLPNGDIDLVISSNTMDRQNKVTVLHTLASVLRRANLAENIQVIARAKVPIVKFISSYGRLPIDISLNQLNGISAGKIVNSYLAALPAVRPLVLVIKSFLNQRGMNEVYSGGLGSYSVICLVISFLQVHAKVRRAEIDPLENLGVLLIEFFELYGKNFGYDDTGICLRNGGSYFSKSERNWINEKQRYLLSIEDPQDQTNDVARSSHGILRVRSTFGGAYEVLTSRLYIRADEMARSRHGQRHLRFTNSDEASILMGIMGVTPEVAKQRRFLEDLHNSGVLQNSLNIPKNAPLPDLPAFLQNATTQSSKATKPRSQTSSSSFSVRSPPTVKAPKQSMAAIMIEDDTESEAGHIRKSIQAGYVSSDSEISFIDKPFKPASAVVSHTVVEQPRSRSSSANPYSRSSLLQRLNSNSDVKEDSRYAATQSPASKRRRMKQDAFSPAPPSPITKKSQKKMTRKISLGSSDSSGEEGEIKEIEAFNENGDDDDDDSSSHIEGQEELISTSDEEIRKATAKSARRKARQMRRDFWAAKGGDSRMDLAYGSLDRD